MTTRHIADTVTDTVRSLAGQAPSAAELLDSVGLQFRRSSTEAALATLGSFLLGAVVGATVALLAAPRSGQETRQALGRQASEAAARVRERFEGMDDRTTIR